MISFHPTISHSKYRRAIKNDGDIREVQSLVGDFFPDCTVILTDSGRSALALAILALGLQGSRLLLPAYVCNVLLPVFEQYNITPVFLDIDPPTFKPPRNAYTASIVETVDAVLLVATYGMPAPEEIIEFLKAKGKIVIEDFAHCSLPYTPEKILGDARCYSLAKTLPVMDGGVAVFREKKEINIPLSRKSISLASLKNWLKLFPTTNAILTHVKSYIREIAPEGAIAPSLHFSGIHRPSQTTIRILRSLLTREKRKPRESLSFTYCHPFCVSEALFSERIFKKNGIAAERVWFDPIIMHPRAHSLWNINPKDYPNTLETAEHIVCAPLWHISSEQEERQYIEHLKKILAGKHTHLWKEA